MSQEYRMSDTIQGRIGGAKCACEVALKEFNRIFADQPTPPTEPLHEMAKRMCGLRRRSELNWCVGCPIGKNENANRRLCCIIEATPDIEEQIEALRAWAAENPVKTYKDDFFEKFPDARTDENGTPKAWLQNVYPLGDAKRIEYLSMLERGQWDKPLGYWEA